MANYFSDILPEELILSSKNDLFEYGKDWLKQYTPKPLTVLLPKSYDQVQDIVKRCVEKKLAIVPSGGRTGYSGGATAMNGEVVVSLSKLNKILDISTIDRTLCCQAGAVTEHVINAANDVSLKFPVSFASQGTSQIGGNIATNAGGINVIRYGNIRRWVLGLKVVTGTGELLELNGNLYKNQTGYDFKSLFIGSEGTLGIIVEATLQLTDIARNRAVVLCGFSKLSDVLHILEKIRASISYLTAFEYFSALGLEKVVALTNLRSPFSKKYPHFLAIDIEPSESDQLGDLEHLFSELMETGLLEDVVIGQNSQQNAELMGLRESISETLAANYSQHKNDISVPIPSIPIFTNELNEKIKAAYPSCEVVVFGHIGDGNLHVNIIKPEDMQEAEFRALAKESDQIIFSLVSKYKGSISAEHGVGILKKDFLHFSRSEAEIELMRQVKKVFDPHGIVNPGKIFKL